MTVEHKSNINYILFGVTKRINTFRIRLIKSFKPRIKFKDNSTLFYKNTEKLITSYSNFNRNWFDENELQKIIQNADNTLNNNFDILGSGLTELIPIDWHSDFKSGFKWDKGNFYKDYIQVDLSNNADVKVPRELSRSHYLLWLGQAYLITKDNKYAKKVVELISNWIEENPLMYSINWGCTMDVSIRVINWIFAYKMIANSGAIDKQFKDTFVNSVYQHAWFIHRNHEKSFVNNANHYDSNIVAQLLLGWLFRYTNQGRKWYEEAKQLLYKEIREQILPSGVIYEKTISYIRLVQEMFVVAYIILKEANEYIPNDIKYLLEKSFLFTYHYQTGAKLVPNVGDQDNARLLPFSISHHLDHRHMIALGATLFNRDDLLDKSYKYLPDLYFLLGEKSRYAFNKLKLQKIKYHSKFFPDAGFFCMKNNNTYLFVNNSGLGKFPDKTHGASSHTHADMLSFTLNIKGIPVFIDLGTHLYTSSKEQRNKYRSTASHNTIEIDKKSQFEITENNLFAYNSKGYPQHIFYKSNETKDIYVGCHDGYSRLNGAPIHRRSFYFNKTKSAINIVDTINSKANNELRVYFHLHPDIRIKHQDTTIKLEHNNFSVDILFRSKNNIKIQIEDSEFSESYGVSGQTKCICINSVIEKSVFKLITHINIKNEK